MATIFDYLDWRGDVPLDVDPFNEVDNLVLSELMYTDFRAIVPEESGSITLQEACNAFFRRRTREQVRAEKWYTAKAPLLMDNMLTGARFHDTKLSYYVDVIDTEQQTQFAAVTFTLPDASTYIAFRGTDGSIVGWKEDFNFMYLPSTEGHNRALQYLNRVGCLLPGPLRVGGHSKGGNFAAYASAFCAESIRTRITDIYSNDGPGFWPEIIDTQEYKNILPKLTKIVPSSSVVGLLMTDFAQPRVVKSQATGLIQHDGFSWLVQRNRFEVANQTMMSELIEKAIVEWVNQLDDDTRKSCVDMVFAALESTGVDGFREMTDQKWKSVGAFLIAFKDFPWEEQRKLWQTIHRLGRVGGTTLGEYLTSLLAKYRATIERKLPTNLLGESK